MTCYDHNLVEAEHNPADDTTSASQTAFALAVTFAVFASVDFYAGGEYGHVIFYFSISLVSMVAAFVFFPYKLAAPAGSTQAMINAEEIHERELMALADSVGVVGQRPAMD